MKQLQSYKDFLEKSKLNETKSTNKKILGYQEYTKKS